MSKKHKKVFKQKIKTMLQQAQQGNLPPAIKTVAQEPAKLAAAITGPVAAPVEVSKSMASVLQIAPVEIVRKDLKKIALLVLIMAAIIVGVAIISDKTTWLSVVADKFYGWARLGS